MAREAIALDSNVLLPLLYLELRPTRIGLDRRVKNIQRSEIELVRDIIAGHPFVFTTPILTEVSNLIDPERNSWGAEFLSYLSVLVYQNVVSDSDFAVLSQRPEYLRLGLADAALIDVCLNGSTLVSFDRSLCSWARAGGGDVIALEEILKDL